MKVGGSPNMVEREAKKGRCSDDIFSVSRSGKENDRAGLLSAGVQEVDQRPGSV